MFAKKNEKVTNAINDICKENRMNISHLQFHILFQEMVVCKTLLFKVQEKSIANPGVTCLYYATAVGMVPRDMFKERVEMTSNNHPTTCGLHWYVMGQGAKQGYLGIWALDKFKALMESDITNNQTGEVLSQGYRFITAVPGTRGTNIKDAMSMARSFMVADQRRVNNPTPVVHENIKDRMKNVLDDILYGSGEDMTVTEGVKLLTSLIDQLP